MALNDLGTGSRYQSVTAAFHASNTLVTGQQISLHLAANNLDHAEEFSIVPFDTPDQFTFSDYFSLPASGQPVRHLWVLTPRQHRASQGLSGPDANGPTFTSIDQ
jgi:hypothetical protein